MNGSELLDAMERVDPAFLAEAETARASKKPVRWLPWAAAAAACLAIAIFGGIKLTHRPAGSTPALELPLLPVEDLGGTFGYEGYLAYSPDELVGASPWDETMTLDTLPVYKNRYPADSAGQSPVQQRTMMKFDPPVELPEELHFTHNSSYEELEAVAEYLKETYAGELDMAEPVTDLQGGDRDIYGRQMYTIHFYDGAGDVAQQLVSRWLAGQRWHCNDDGRLSLVWKDAYDLSEPVGDYPILTPAEARELLCNGNYITTVPYAMPGGDYIVRAELMYRADAQAQYFMPYYRFLVEMPEAYYGQPQTELQYGSVVDGQPVEGAPPSPTPRPADDGSGLRDYGAYYVPAVRPEYLTGLPTWDGSFN